MNWKSFYLINTNKLRTCQNRCLNSESSCLYLLEVDSNVKGFVPGEDMKVNCVQTNGKRQVCVHISQLYMIFGHVLNQDIFYVGFM